MCSVSAVLCTNSWDRQTHTHTHTHTHTQSTIPFCSSSSLPISLPIIFCRLMTAASASRPASWAGEREKTKRQMSDHLHEMQDIKKTLRKSSLQSFINRYRQTDRQKDRKTERKPTTNVAGGTRMCTGMYSGHSRWGSEKQRETGRFAIPF